MQHFCLTISFPKKTLLCKSMSSLPFMKLNYSINNLLSHYSNWIFFTCCCSHVSSCKRDLLQSCFLMQKGLAAVMIPHAEGTFFPTFNVRSIMRSIIYKFSVYAWTWMLARFSITWKKNYPRDTGLLICKTRSRLGKTSC